MKTIGPNQVQPSRDRPDGCPSHARFGRVQGRAISIFFWAEILCVLIFSMLVGLFLEKNWSELFPAKSGSARRMPDRCPSRSASGSGHLNIFLGWHLFCDNCFHAFGITLDEF